MSFEKFKINSLVFQLQYPTAFNLWDSAGVISSEMLQIWPDLEAIETAPNQQTLKAVGVAIQTGVKGCSVTLSTLPAIDRRTIDRLSSAYKIWRAGLAFTTLSRVSTRAVYTRAYDSLEAATAAFVSTNLVHVPVGGLFGQPETGRNNAFEVAYRFEDEKGFALFRLKSEEIKYQVKLDVPFQDSNLEKTVSQVTLDFDRGLLGSIGASSFIMDEWLKGFQHVLRQNADKLLAGVSP